MPSKEIAQLLDLREYRVVCIDEETEQTVTLFIEPTHPHPICSGCRETSGRHLISELLGLSRCRDRYPAFTTLNICHPIPTVQLSLHLDYLSNNCIQFSRSIVFGRNGGPVRVYVEKCLGRPTLISIRGRCPYPVGVLVIALSDRQHVTFLETDRVRIFRFVCRNRTPFHRDLPVSFTCYWNPRQREGHGPCACKGYNRSSCRVKAIVRRKQVAGT